MSFLNNTGTASTNTSGGLLGGANTTTNAGAGTSAGGGLFGSKPAGSLFGSTNTSSGGGGLFGGASSTTPAAGSTGGLFGGATSAAPTGSLFGGATSTTPTGGLFGAASSTTPAPSGSAGSLFGNPPSTTTTNTTAPTSSSLFAGFGTSKPADSNSTTAPKPASSFFGAPSTSTSGNTTGGGLFGAKPADSTSGTTSQTSTSAPALGGGLFGAKPAATAPASAFPAPSTSGFSLGGSTASTAAPTFSLGGNKDSNAPAAPTGGLFGGKPIDKKDSAPAPAPAVSFSLTGGIKTDDKNTTVKDDQNKALGTTASNPVVAVPPPSMLRGKTIEEIVNRWTSELETHVKDFSKFAGEVVVWDRALIENGNNLAALYSHVLAAERQQNEIDQTLDHIEQQQKDLLSTLDTYEKVSQEILGGQGGSLRSLDTGPADTERDKNYMLATDLNTNLDDLSASLTQMIDSVNALSTSQKPANEGEDPMAQISQVLSSHLESLQWIDTAARELDTKVDEVERRVKESGHSFGNSQKGRGFGLNR